MDEESKFNISNSFTALQSFTKKTKQMQTTEKIRILTTAIH